MELKEMIKVMEWSDGGGTVECADRDCSNWEIVDTPLWNWDDFDYRIAHSKQKVTIEKWLLKDVDSGEYFIMESSDVDLTLKDFPKWRKLKLIETYEVEL